MFERARDLNSHLHDRTRPSAGAAVALLLAVLACAGGQEHHAPLAVIDDEGVTVRLDRPARRVLSLVPSATDVFIALDVADRLVARTEYDTAPEVAALPSVGGGLDPGLERVVAARPDLVVSWAEAGPSALRAQLESLGITVFALRTQDTSDAFRAVERLGRLVGRDSAGAALASRIRHELRAIHASVADRPRPSTVYLIEHDPPMVAGPDTFVAQVIGVAGGRHAFPELTALWPQISLEALLRRQPDVLIVPRLGSADAFVAGLGERPGWRRLEAVQAGRIVLVPPDLLSRPGPGLPEAARMLRDRLHPDARGARRGP